MEHCATAEGERDRDGCPQSGSIFSEYQHIVTPTTTQYHHTRENVSVCGGGDFAQRAASMLPCLFPRTESVRRAFNSPHLLVPDVVKTWGGGPSPGCFFSSEREMGRAE